MPHKLRKFDAHMRVTLTPVCDFFFGGSGFNGSLHPGTPKLVGAAGFRQ